MLLFWISFKLAKRITSIRHPTLWQCDQKEKAGMLDHFQRAIEAGASRTIYLFALRRP